MRFSLDSARRAGRRSGRNSFPFSKGLKREKEREELDETRREVFVSCIRNSETAAVIFHTYV